MLKAQTAYVGADAHTRRVTLTLLRAAACCPDDVRCIVDDLQASRWDWSALSSRDFEALYGLVTDDLVERAKAEFSADTTTVVDVSRNPKAHPEFIDADGDTYCPLCGHKHVRWGFRLRNQAEGVDPLHGTGTDLLAGSTCVVAYGFRVDGEATAEASLQAMNKAIARLVRHANRADWRTAHPDHESVMERLAAVTKLHRLPYRVQTAMGGYQYWNRWRSLAKWAKAAVKYYQNNGFLTDNRTADLRARVAEADAYLARQTAVEVEALPAQWAAWLQRYGVALSPSERAWVRSTALWGMQPRDRARIERLERRLTMLPPPPPLPGACSAPGGRADNRVWRDDVSDLPGML